MTETKVDEASRTTRIERVSLRQDWEERTYKREIAVLGLGVWLVLTLITTLRFLIIPPDVATLNAMGTAFNPIYTIATTMIFVFAGAAFGIDAYAKQIK
jgi:uncharacterized membrane protein YkgB